MLSITIPRDEDLVKKNSYYKIRCLGPIVKDNFVWRTAVYEVWERMEKTKIFSDLNMKINELEKELELSLYLCDFSKKTFSKLCMKKNIITEGLNYCDEINKKSLFNKLKKILYLMKKFIS
jgi:hypothetical protein